MRDASAKGRLGGKKLTATKVGDIKYRLGLGDTHRSLALQYGVSTSAVGQIARGETWPTVEALRPDDDAEHQG
jgi:transcriptional regulator with XRE-family HTH domain